MGRRVKKNRTNIQKDFNVQIRQTMNTAKMQKGIFFSKKTVRCDNDDGATLKDSRGHTEKIIREPSLYSVCARVTQYICNLDDSNFDHCYYETKILFFFTYLILKYNLTMHFDIIQKKISKTDYLCDFMGICKCI